VPSQWRALSIITRGRKEVHGLFMDVGRKRDGIPYHDLRHHRRALQGTSEAQYLENGAGAPPTSVKLKMAFAALTARI
jgi:hypothetical protein